MLGRFFAVAAPSLGLALLAGCGTTTNVSNPSSFDGGFDAGCADPNVVNDGGGTVDPPEAGAPKCPTGVCNYQEQTGCAANQACRPQFSASSPAVSPGCEAAGTGKSGATCASSSDCAVGYFCADQACRKQCCGGDWSACDADERCFRQLQVEAGGTVVDSGMELCFPINNCDPLDATSCPTNLACRVVDPTGAVACEPQGSAQLGEACSATVACVAGAFCGGETCLALCRADVCGAPACAEGQGTCTHYARDPVGVGECTP
jgi:hypothetical protein